MEGPAVFSSSIKYKWKRPLPFVIPSEAEGSAVLQARPGNVFRPKRSVGICSTALSPSQLFDKSLVLRVSTEKLAPRGQFEICKVEARRHGASYQRKRCSILQSRGKPAARFHYCLENLAGLRPSAQMQFRIVSFSVDYVYDQCTPRIEMPHLIGRDAMECGKVCSLQQKENSRGRRSVSLKSRRQSTPGNGQVRLIGDTIVAALGMRAQA